MNEQQRRQQEMQTAQRRFLQALSAGQVGAKDRFGRAVGPNMKVLFKLPFDLIWDVASVAPMLDANDTTSTPVHQPNSAPPASDITAAHGSESAVTAT